MTNMIQSQQRVKPQDLQEALIVLGIYSVWNIWYFVFVGVSRDKATCTGMPYYFSFYCKWILPIGLLISACVLKFEYWMLKNLLPAQRKSYFESCKEIKVTTELLLAAGYIFASFSANKETCEDPRFVNFVYFSALIPTIFVVLPWLCCFLRLYVYYFRNKEDF